MAQIMNTESPLPRDLEADPPAAAAPLVSDRLMKMIDQAEADLVRAPGEGAVRSDGWTPERVRIFLETLADRGLVGEAAAAAGMSRRSAYALRRRAEGRPFCTAWRGALLLARQRLTDEAMERAINGCFEIVVRDGKVVAERHRHDNRFTLAMLDWADRQAQSHDPGSRAARLAADEFEEYVDIVCAGGEGAEDFVEDRRDAPLDGEPGLLARLASYVRRVATAG
jgi:hypothetical protein